MPRPQPSVDILSRIKRISEYEWEIPKGAVPESKMQVPVRIFATEELLKCMSLDQTLFQAANVAWLPGIQKQSMVMPDGHSGYGFPIGGVAATDIETGVISPGGVGFDINCLSGDSEILHSHGYTMKIKEMHEAWSRCDLACRDFSSGRSASTGIERYLKQKPRHDICRVRTTAGDEIVASVDHPFWTPVGMVELGAIKEGASIARHSFKGVPFEQPETIVLVTKEDIEGILEKRAKSASGNTSAQVINYLTQRGLLPLSISSEQIPFLAKILGYLLGGGTMYYTGGRGKGVAWFYGNAEDLEEIRADVVAAGFTPSRIYRRTREHHIENLYGETSFVHTEESFKVASTAFVTLMEALGEPVGAKASQDIVVPPWLTKSPHWIQRLFLAAFFGAELSSPKAFPERNYDFYTPVLNQNKRDGYVESGIEFMKGISALLAGFGVETKVINSRPEQINPDGTQSHQLRLILSSTPESLLNLWGKVGFEYNHKRTRLAALAVEYIKRKQEIVRQREEASSQAVAMHAVGVSPREIYSELSGQHVNRRFLESSVYEGRKTSPRAPLSFPTFDEFSERAQKGIEDTTMVWAQIESIELVKTAFDVESDHQDDLDSLDFVYDFTVEHEDHNFIANGFVVSNCGVRLLRTNLDANDFHERPKQLIDTLFDAVPSGLGSSHATAVTRDQLQDILKLGVKFLVKEMGIGTEADVLVTEEQGSMPGADPSDISPAAIKRGLKQVGTLGSGNHFLEIQAVDEIYDEVAAKTCGITHKDQLMVMIHTGSRGLGHQVASDYLRTVERAMKKYNLSPPDRQLACAPTQSPEGQSYLRSMAAAANFAWCNREAITHYTRQGLEKHFKQDSDSMGIELIYDVAHNIAKRETHSVDGEEKELIVMRKGATRAFPASRSEVPAKYSSIGQPVLIPGSMSTYSYLLVGGDQSLEKTFGSTAHGAGRMLSRTAARKRFRGEKIQREMASNKIYVKAAKFSILAEEHSLAYKDVNQVVQVSDELGIGRSVARMRPLGVVKG